MTERQEPDKSTRSSPYTAESVIEELGQSFCDQMMARGASAKWTPARWATILHASWFGMGKVYSARCGRVCAETLRLWREEFPELDASWEAARPLGALALRERLEGVQDEHTLRWLLERQSPDHAPPPKRIEQIGPQPPVHIIHEERRRASDSIAVPVHISGHKETEEGAGEDHYAVPDLDLEQPPDLDDPDDFDDDPDQTE